METVNCPFCNPHAKDILHRNDLCYARWDIFPVSAGHILVIPFRHMTDYFSMTNDERHAVVDLIMECKDLLEKTHHSDGYNIGFNVGTTAVQTVRHSYCHVIPRYTGDVPDAQGGIRGVVPGRRRG